MHLHRQLASILRGLVGTFTTCACGGASADCVLARATRFVAAPDDGPPPPHKRRRVDCGPLVGPVAARASAARSACATSA
jgi:hypothetical protein